MRHTEQATDEAAPNNNNNNNNNKQHHVACHVQNSNIDRKRKRASEARGFDGEMGTRLNAYAVAPGVILVAEDDGERIDKFLHTWNDKFLHTWNDKFCTRGMTSFRTRGRAAW